MNFPTLYGKSSSGKLLVWEVSTSGDTILVRHGQLGSDKIQSKTTTCKPKNVGRANATTAEQQACLEAEAKWVKQKKKGYYETKEEALAHVEWTPMKLQGFKDCGHKIVWPAYFQPKLDGQRMMVSASGKGISKQGEEQSFPEHIQKNIDTLVRALGDEFVGLDGEIYAGLESEGGFSLQRIISAFRKENEDTPKLKYYIYDIPVTDEPFRKRVERLHSLESVKAKYNLQAVEIVPTNLALGLDDLQDNHKWLTMRGYEGTVVRNTEGLYEFGKRSYDAQKIKDRSTTEAKVLSVSVDKNEQGVLSCQLQNGVVFECLMLKDADPHTNLRLYENACSLVGGYIEVEYESLSDSGVPLKPTGKRVRPVDDNWEALD